MKDKYVIIGIAALFLPFAVFLVADAPQRVYNVILASAGILIALQSIINHKKIQASSQSETK